MRAMEMGSRLTRRGSWDTRSRRMRGAIQARRARKLGPRAVVATGRGGRGDALDPRPAPRWGQTRGIVEVIWSRLGEWDVQNRENGEPVDPARHLTSKYS